MFCFFAATRSTMRRGHLARRFLFLFFILWTVQSCDMSHHAKRISCIFLISGLLLHVFYGLVNITISLHALSSVEIRLQKGEVMGGANRYLQQGPHVRNDEDSYAGLRVRPFMMPKDQPCHFLKLLNADLGRLIFRSAQMLFRAPHQDCVS